MRGSYHSFGVEDVVDGSVSFETIVHTAGVPRHDDALLEKPSLVGQRPEEVVLSVVELEIPTRNVVHRPDSCRNGLVLCLAEVL